MPLHRDLGGMQIHGLANVLLTEYPVNSAQVIQLVACVSVCISCTMPLSPLQGAISDLHCILLGFAVSVPLFTTEPMTHNRIHTRAPMFL